MKSPLPLFAQAPVLVVGDVMLDRYWYGSTTRVSPEAPVPVVKVTRTEDRPGGAANVALNIAALGAPVQLIGVTGADEAANALIESLHSVGVRTNFLRSVGQPTIVKLRAMSRQQQLLRMDFEESFNINAEALLAEVEAALDGVKVMVLSDYGKGTIGNHQALLKAAQQRGIAVLADPKGTDFSIYRGATLLTPNMAEFEAVAGPCADEAELMQRGSAMLKELELGALLITRGEQGMTLLRNDMAALHLPARAREVFDVTGAGDTVLGRFLLSGGSVPDGAAAHEPERLPLFAGIPGTGTHLLEKVAAH